MDFSKMCVLKLDKNDLIFPQRNFGLPAPKLTALSSERREIQKSFFIMAHSFHERPFCAHKTQLKR